MVRAMETMESPVDEQLLEVRSLVPAIIEYVEEEGGSVSGTALLKDLVETRGQRSDTVSTAIAYAIQAGQLALRPPFQIVRGSHPPAPQTA